MNTPEAERCVRRLESIWGKLPDDRFAGYVEWFENKDVPEAAALAAVDELSNTATFMPKPAEIHKALSMAGALGDPRPGTGDQRIVGRLMRSIEDDCKVSAHNQSITLREAIIGHRLTCLEILDILDPNDPDYGIWRDRALACEKLLMGEAA